MLDRRLAIYLKDHHAAGTAGRRLAERAAKNVSPDVEGRDQLLRVATEIGADLGKLEEIMGSQGVPPSKVKDTLAVLFETLGRLKLNGRLRGRSRLSDVVELETLLIGITGKAALWQALGEALPDPEHSYETLIARARAQIEVVSRSRDSAARKTFGGRASGAHRETP
jgi:hypothetical protein